MLRKIINAVRRGRAPADLRRADQKGRSDMFIQTESTPNPATLKFLPGETVMATGTANFEGPEAAARSPLARRLFGVDGVERVFLGADFVSIGKADTIEWLTLKPAVLGAIMEHYLSGAPVIDIEPAAAKPTAAGGAFDDADTDVVNQIKELLETRVRPAVAQDGGDIIFHGFEDGVVSLEMHGACAGCPSSTMTLKHGIENMLRHYVPEVREVRAVT